MKKRIIAAIGICVLVLGIVFSACSKAESEKILVAYFSPTGNTKAVALQLAENTGADLFEIVPKEPYTEVQLGYNDPEQRITKEQNDDSARVEIAGTVENFEQYGKIYIGYPIWYGKAPKIIVTFLESYEFEGKEVIPFCTSDNDGIESGIDEIKDAAPDAEWNDGERFDSNEIKNSVDNGKFRTDSPVIEKIDSFAKKTAPEAAEKQSKNKKDEKQFGGEEASAEIDTKAQTSTTGYGTTAQTTTETTTEATTEKPAETTTESTTLGENDTPYIPIP